MKCRERKKTLSLSVHFAIRNFLCLSPNSDSFDYFLRPRQHVGRDRQPKLFCGLEIDDQLHVVERFDPKIARMSFRLELSVTYLAESLPIS